MMFLLEIGKQDSISRENALEMIGYGAQKLLIGVVTVFAVLALIWGALALFKVLFHDLPEKRRAARKPIDEPAPQNDVAEESATAPEELVAVLAAAIAAAEEESGGKKFRVVSFKRN